MTLAKIASKLNSLYPTAYSHFDKLHRCPFIIYFIDGSNNVAADDCRYLPVSKLRIELYTAKKDLTAETTIENALKDGIMEFYSKTEVYIESEKVYQISYESEVILNG